MPQANAATSTSLTFNGPYECLLCGEQGHGMQRYPTADTMIKTGTTARCSKGQLTWPNGNPIIRSGSENILTAISRELAYQNRVKTERPPTTTMIRELELCYPDNSSDSDEQVEAQDNGEVTARMVNVTEVYLVLIQAS